MGLKFEFPSQIRLQLSHTERVRIDSERRSSTGRLVPVATVATAESVAAPGSVCEAELVGAHAPVTEIN